MQYILCDPDIRDILYPFSQLHAFADIRIGLWTLRERYDSVLENVCVYESRLNTDDFCIFINSAVIPDENLFDLLQDLKAQEAIASPNELIAVCVSGNAFKGFSLTQSDILHIKEIIHDLCIVKSPFDITAFNQLWLTSDIHQLNLADASSTLATTNTIIGSGKIITDEGVNVSCAFLNTTSGPIYLGKNVHVMEGACLRGPLAVLDNSVVKMGATLYGATTIGKQCVVGGEIKNSVFFDYSNKAHHGYIGDAVIGSWCNMGAGTSCSNVKNNAGEIYLWNPLLQQKVSAGLKCGVIMGDHTKTAINTSLNSGTVTGICCNVVKQGFPPKYIADFTWDVETKELYREDKMLNDVHNWMKMKQKKLEEKDMRLLLQLYKERKNTTQ